MRNTSRRRIRSSVPQTNFWIETKSMSADYYIPNMSYNPNYPKRIKFADGSTVVTTDVKVDFSQKEGIKRIEYVEILKLSNLTSYLYAPGYYMQGRENVQKMIDTFNLKKGKDYIIYVDNEYNYTISQRVKQDYQITDFKKDTTNGRIYYVGGQHLSDFTLDENYKKFSIHTNKEHLDFTFKGNANTQHLDLRYIPALTWNLTNKELIQLNYFRLYKVDFADVKKIDVPMHPNGTVSISNTNLQDVELYPCKGIELGHNPHFENKNKLIPRVKFLSVSSSSYKSIQLEHPEDLINLNVRNGLRNNHGNPLTGTDVLNLEECVNLERLDIADNPTILARTTDFRNFKKLKAFTTSGGTTKEILLPNSVQNIDLQEFAYDGIRVNLSHLELKELAITYMSNFKERVQIGSLNKLSSFITRFATWDEEYLLETLTKIADNDVHKGFIFIELYHLIQKDENMYGSVERTTEEPIIAKIIEQCRRIKQKNWNFHEASNKIILNNI